MKLSFKYFHSKVYLICYLWIKVVCKTLVPTRENSFHAIILLTVCNNNKTKATEKVNLRNTQDAAINTFSCETVHLLHNLSVSSSSQCNH